MGLLGVRERVVLAEEAIEGKDEERGALGREWVPEHLRKRRI